MKSLASRGIWIFAICWSEAIAEAMIVNINISYKPRLKSKIGRISGYNIWVDAMSQGIAAFTTALSNRKQSSLLGGLREGKIPSGAGMPQRCTQALRSNAQLCDHQFKPLSAGTKAAQLPLSPRCSSFIGSWKAPADRTAMHPADMGSLAQVCSKLSSQALDNQNCVCGVMLSTSELFTLCIFLHCYCTIKLKTSRASCPKSTRKFRGSQLPILAIGQRKKNKLFGSMCAMHVRKVQLAVSFIKN